MIAPHTLYLKSIMEHPELNTLLEKALSTYPMYEPVNLANFGLIPSRSELNKKLLNHYKYREIAFETPMRFIDELETAINEIMPKYYSLYKSLDILNGIDDPFGNVDIKEVFEEERTGLRSDTSTENMTSSSDSSSSSTANSESTTDTTNTNNNRAIKSDTPQSKLSDIGEAANTTSGIYASEVNFNNDSATSQATNSGTDTTTGTSTSDVTGTNSKESNQNISDSVKHTLTKIGNQGVNTYAHDLLELRELFINIEKQIIEDDRIQELFYMFY